MSDGRSTSTYSGENLLFLTDEQLRQGIEAMFLPIGASLPIPIVFSQTWRMAAPITALSISFIARQAQQSTTCSIS